MHKELTQSGSTQCVDHIDGNPLNNQRSNLRLCTKRENARNQKRRADNKSGYKGVHQRIRSSSWIARIQVQDDRHFIGEYSTSEEAARAYDAAARALYGEFARLNFPVGTEQKS